MRIVLLVPLALILTAGAGWIVCRGFGFGFVVRDVIAAGLICLISADAAMVPLILTRHARQGAVAQAALVATMVHLMLSGAFAAVVFLAKVPPGIGPSFLYWLLTFYWISLIVVVIGCVRAVKSAPADQPIASTGNQSRDTQAS
jgi:hypothetical protein